MDMRYTLSRNLTLSSLLLLLPLCLPPFTLPLASASASDAPSLATFLQSIKRDSSEGSCAPSAEDANVAGCPSTFCGVISCTSDGNVEVVDLSGRGLTGTIPLNSLGTLKMLKSLNLSNNLFSGTLPDDLGSLHQLEHMDLSQNNFSGLIPLKFSGLESLVTLSLAVNQLSGSIPPSLGELQHLTSLNLSSNSFINRIPMEISSLASLTLLDLHSNQLSGQIDSSFLALSSLTTVDFSSNKLSGFIPWQPNDTLPLLRTVEYVNLSHNQLTGPLVPEKFASMFAESLRVLDMSHNQLSGSLPDFEFVLVLEVLRLSNNYFNGALPHTLFSATPLEELDLSNNSLTGGIPRVLSTSLKVLNVSFNSLTGTIPPKIGACVVVDLSHNMLQGDLSLMQYWSEMLEVLDLSFNKLSGALVNLDIKFVRLTTLNLSHNELYGPIPSSYGLFPKLNMVDLSFNQLNGTIPDSFFNSSTLSFLSVSNNLLAGGFHVDDAVSFTSVLSYPPSSSSQFPLQTGQVSPMVALHLSSNKLDGTIPIGIARYQKLEELDLSENSFSGKMPSALCNLTALQMLDLSSNTLSGPIPAGLSSSLLMLHLADNNLSGLIPEDLRRFPNTSFFPGNEGLVSWLMPWNSSSPLMSSTTGNKRSIGAAAKAGMIGGCLAGVLLFLMVGLLVYYRMSKAQIFSGGAAIGSNDVGKTHRMWSPCAAYFAFHDHPDNVPPGTSFSADFLLQRPGKASAQSKYRGALKDARNSWGIDGKAEAEDSLKTRGIEMSPSRSRNNVSTEPSRSGEESIQADSPVVLKVRSPDRLAGDLHFLDKSLKFSAEELSRAPAEVLGRSSHGTSYKATLDNGHVLTVKWLREGLAKSKKEFSREAKKFAKVRHPNLIPLRGYYWGPREHEKLILSDFVSTGSLAAHFADRTGQRYAPISWKQRLEIVVDIARGLLYLHEERHLPHGNLKATNVLLDGPTNLSARLADYSLHQLMTCEGTANQILNAGALGYRAPELATMRKPRPSTKGDVYAFGVLVLEVLTGKGAGDIISGQSGAVDLTDWVRLLATEIRTMDCFDPLLVGADGHHEPPKGMHDVLAVALKCISPLPVDRPHIRSVYEDLSSISV